MSTPSYFDRMGGDLLSRANLFHWVREFCRNCAMGPGYYMEFGAFNGEGMVEAWRQMRGVADHMFGFDTFAGIPPLTLDDQAGLALMPSFREGNYRSRDRARVQDFITASVPADRLTLIEGDIRDTLSAMDKDMFRVRGVPLCIHIDVDIYSSAKAALDFVEDLVVDGTWIMLDDYWTYRGNPHHGERRAWDEWLAASNRVGATAYGNYRGVGRAYICHLK